MGQMSRAREARELREHWLDLLERQMGDTGDPLESQANRLKSQKAFIIANAIRLRELVSTVRNTTESERLKLTLTETPLEIISDEDIEGCTAALESPEDFLDSDNLISELDYTLVHILSYASALFLADASDRGDSSEIDDLLSYGVGLECYHDEWVMRRVVIPVEQWKVIYWLMQCEYFIRRNDSSAFLRLGWPDYSHGSADFYLPIIRSALAALRELRGRAVSERVH